MEVTNQYYTYSIKNRRIIIGYTLFNTLENHNILYPSKTRWLVMEDVSKRLLEQGTALAVLCQLFHRKPSGCHKIYAGLRSSDLKLYYSFMGYILPILNHLNLEFQSESVRLHSFLSTIENGLKTVLENFI